MALTDNILAYWKLDANGSAVSLADSTGNGNTLTNNGGVVLGTGKIGGCGIFDGTGTSLSSALQVTNTSTFSAWFTTSANSPQYAQIIGNEGTQSGNYRGFTFIINNTGEGDLAFYSTSGGFQCAGIYNDGSWHHIVLSCNSGVATIYVDGAAQSGTVSSNLVDAGDFYIGINNAFSGRNFIGSIDEVGIWSRALSSTEVTALYNSGAGITYPFGAVVTPHKNIVPRGNNQGKLGTPALRWAEGHFQSALTLGGSPVATADSILAQVNSDWNATSGVSQILNKPSLAPVATSGSASDLSTGTLPLARLDSLVSRDDINNSFTSGQTITAPANTSALTASYSVTGANTTALVSLTGTWNTTGVARGILLNITDTASAATSRLLDLGVGSRTQYAFTKSRQFWLFNSAPATQDASNFERGFMRWNSNVLEIGTEAGGTGTANRSIRLLIGTQGTGVVFTASGSGVNVDARSFSNGGGWSVTGGIMGGLTNCNYVTGAADPTTTSLTNGNWQVYRNTTSGQIRLWANNNGTMVSVALS
jgi:hypothetical protein